MDAILDKLPMIERCNNICNFLLDHYGLKKHFKELMDIESEARDKAELYRIFEHYGIAEWSEETPELLYKTNYNKDEHVATICKYLAIKEKDYDRELFIVKPVPKHDSTWNKWGDKHAGPASGPKGADEKQGLDIPY